MSIEKIIDEIIEAMEESNYKPTNKEIKKLLGYDYNKKEIKICKKKIRRKENNNDKC